MCLSVRWLVLSITELSPAGDQASQAWLRDKELRACCISRGLSLRGTRGHFSPAKWLYCPLSLLLLSVEGWRWTKGGQMLETSGSQVKVAESQPRELHLSAFSAVTPHPPLPLFPVVLKSCLCCPPQSQALPSPIFLPRETPSLPSQGSQLSPVMAQSVPGRMNFQVISQGRSLPAVSLTLKTFQRWVSA